MSKTLTKKGSPPLADVTGSAWSKKLPNAAGWWWIRGLNAHPPVQVVAIQRVCGVWAALIWSQWRAVTDYKGCEWAGPLVEPTEPNNKLTP